ncbi:MAG: tetratricopeptide repeat protein [Pseudomonadota bacterium]
MQVSELFAELRDRHLYRVAAIYAAGGWLLLQVADVVAESFAWPAWAMRGLILLVIVGFPVTLLVFWFLDEVEHPDDPDSDTADADIPEQDAQRPGLIVLPFDCFSDRREDRWAADALTEDLTALLARFSEYALLARNTAFAYRGGDIDVRRLHRELGVRYALEGSLRRLPNGLRVTAQLLDAREGTHLWAEQYDRRDDELHELYGEVCRAIALHLGIELSRAEMKLSKLTPPSQWSAWELYQQARGSLHFGGWSQRNFQDAAATLREAISKDPEFASARALLALILALGYWAHLFPDRETAYEEALASAERAIAMAPESSEVMGFAGCALSDLGHHERGIPVIERAIELNPANGQAVAALGAAKVLSGRLEEGIADLTLAVSISPADPGLAPWSTMLSIAQTYLGNAADATQWADRACKADARYFGGFLAKAVAKASLGELPGAQAALEEARRLNPRLSAQAASALIGAPAWEELAKAGIRLPMET